eukprot:654888-Rhodomonas_salina.2
MIQRKQVKSSSVTAATIPVSSVHAHTSAAYGRVHAQTAAQMASMTRRVRMMAGKMTSKVHSATAGVRMRRLQSRFAQQSQFQKHFPKMSIPRQMQSYSPNPTTAFAYGRHTIHCAANRSETQTRQPPTLRAL